MKSKILTILVMIFTSCLAAASAPNNVNAILSKYANNPKGWSALNYAIEQKDYKAALVLLNYTFDVNKVDDKYNALHRTLGQVGTLPSNKDQVELAKQLVLMGVDIRTQSGGSFFTSAIYSRNEELINLIIENGADVNECNGAPLRAALETCNKIMIFNLIDKGACLDLSEALAIAVHARNYEMINLWIDYGADLSQGDYLLYTVSHGGYPGDPKMVRFLLERGANPNAQVTTTILGDSILGAALGTVPLDDEGRLYKDEIIHLLLNYGAQLP